MTAEIKESVYKGVDLHSNTNNTEHHTSVISVDQLIVRRGQPFKLTLNLAQPFTPDAHPLKIEAVTGQHPSEEQGTKSLFGVPDNVERSPEAKAVWTAELDKGSYPLMGNLNLTITPPASTPIGQYTVKATYKNEETLLAELVVLFNPWCPDDWVFLPDEEERDEYVMNEQGIIYKGSGNYISPMSWDFGQFEENMVKICLMILDLNHKHFADPADDVSARCNPIYVSRVVSAMINSEDDHGVLKGRWVSPFWGGVAPSHWNGSYPILKKWYNIDCYPVKYGQCWVFAGVMCSVMRLLGIPCRVVTNYQSAHDNNRNLTIDVYHADYGVREKESKDSVWNYHVWVEGWMRRPDLAEDGKYDGWQVLDPTPQEKSEGVYCCGPAPVLAVREGETALKYDVPFVYAEVNADCIDWLVKADGSLQTIWSDNKKVGQNISTKSVGSRKRKNITDSYKYREGTDEERSVFTYASTRDFPRKDESEEKKEDEENQSTNGPVDNEGTERDETVNGTTETTDEVIPNTPPNGTTETTDEVIPNTPPNGTTGPTDEVTPSTPPPSPPPPPVSMRFEEVNKPMDGKDVSLNLVLHSESTVARPLSINISVQGMMYNGTPAVNIQTEVKEGTLQPGKDLSIPILVPFSTYNKHMVNSDSMKISAMVTDKQNPEHVYLAEDDIVLVQPPISITVSSQVRLNRDVDVEVAFMNPVEETLKQCTLTLSGSGLLREAFECSIPDLKPNHKIRVQFRIKPHKIGTKTLVADFDCSVFRDIKASCTFNVSLS